MSYILEALKKSSEERRRRQQEEERQDPLLFDQAVSPKAAGKNRLLPLLLIIAFAVLSLLSWQFFSATGDDPVSGLNPEQTASAVPEQKPDANTTDKPQSDGGKTQEQPAQIPSASAETKEATAPGTALGNPDQTSAPGLALIEELPLAIRAQLPEMKYSGHVFSPNPRLRMILINTTVVREGDLIDSDTRLVEITRDGLVMSYKGTNFKVVLF